MILPGGAGSRRCGGESVLREDREHTMLKKLPLMADIANAAVFLASDHASRMTGTTVDVTAGTISALNYKTGPIAFVKH